MHMLRLEWKNRPPQICDRNYNIHKNNIHSQLAPPLTGLKYILSIKYSKICQLLYDSED